MPRACPACARTWGSDATFCGACGALLDPAAVAPAHPSGRTRGRRGLAIAGVLAVAVVTTLAVPRVDLPSFGGSGIEDDGIALPTEAVASDPPSTRPVGPQTVRCSRGRVPADDCVQWRVEAPAEAPAAIVLPDTDVLLGRESDGLVARDPEDGEVRWRRPPGEGPVFPVMQTDEALIVIGREGRVRALDLLDGTERWSRDGARPISYGPPTSGAVLPVATGGQGGEGPTGVLTLDPRDGTPLWRWSPPWAGPVSSLTSIADAVLVAGGGHLARLDARTGAVTWTVETVDDAIVRHHPPGIVSTRRFAPDAADGPSLLLHLEATGERLAELPVDNPAGLVVAGDVVAVHRPREGEVHGYDAYRGERRWTWPLGGGGALGTPIGEHATDRIVAMAPDAGVVSRIDPATGDPVWQTELPPSDATGGSRSFLGQPLLVDDRVVVEDENSRVSVLDVRDGHLLVSVDAGPGLDVRSIDPLVLEQGGTLMRIAVEGPETGQ